MSDTLPTATRVSDPGIRALYRLENRWQAWLDVEVALARAQAELGVISVAAAEAIAGAARLDKMDRARIDEGFARTGHTIVPLVWELGRIVGDPHGGWVHWGATTQNITQTGDLLVLRQAHAVFLHQIGVLHQRIAPAGALALRQPLKPGEPVPEMSLTALDGAAVRIGGARGGRSQLVLFVSPDCAICESLLPAVRSAQGAERAWLDIVLASDGDAERQLQFVKDKGLGKFPYVLSEQLGRSFGVAKLPYAVLIDEAGKLSATGLVNTREHLESLFVAKERGVASIQQFLGQRDAQRAPLGE